MDPHSVCELHDEQLLQEIRLLGDFVLAVSTVSRHLTQDEVDQILEQDRATPDPHREPDRTHGPGG